MKQFRRYPWFAPAELHVFGGRWDVSSLLFPFSLLRRLPGRPMDKIPASDIRDWTEIEAWANGIARKINPSA